MPSITSSNWGSITLDNGVSVRDLIIRSTAAGNSHSAWYWNYLPEVMHHDPGLREVDVNHLILDNSILPKNVILSTGRYNMLKISGRIVDYIRAKGINNIYVVNTDDAIRLYNSMEKDGISVIALIHSTC